MNHKEKQKVIENIVSVPDKGKRIFWAKEIKFLNILFEKYPDKKFWTNLSFYDKLDSMLLLRSGYYAEELKKKYKKFNYKIPQCDEIILGDKCGEDLNISRPIKTIKDFLS